MKKGYLSGGLLLLCLHGYTFAQADVQGSKDHPLLSRYPGSYIDHYSTTDFDQYKIATGPLKNNTVPTITIEGKITEITYRIPSNSSTLQILRNYQQALEKGGFKKTLACDTLKECGGDFMTPLMQGQGSNAENRYLRFGMFRDADDYRFWSGILEKNTGKVGVALFVKKVGSNDGQVLVEIVEAKAMATGLIKLDVAAIEKGLGQDGKVVLDGVFFDHDKATMKSESTSTINVIAQFLQSHPKINVFVVGHTDNVGDYKHNLSLSQQRAETVVQALISKNHISANRLQAVGVGPVSPQRSNSSDANRAENRRVELVVR